MIPQQTIKQLSILEAQATEHEKQAQAIRADVHDAAVKLLDAEFGVRVGGRYVITHRKIVCEITRIMRVNIQRTVKDPHGDPVITGMNVEYRPVKKDGTLHANRFDCFVSLGDIAHKEIPNDPVPAS